ncbi:MAG TPA: RNA polymerase sigma factor [Isosphaeraceae bacterium]|jgi:RNA polymerase sigma-70 factor (ECF subfamily)|nr:RNA polymerase sigma factor [Isosphaeraceae bacterium]
MPEAQAGVLTTSDEQLVRLAREGDRPAQEELFCRHFGVAYRVAFRLLGNEQDALDAVQDALLKAVQHLKDFDGRSGFRTWLLRIVNNAALDTGRRRRRRPTLKLHDSESNGPEPAITDDPAQGLHRDDLRRMLDGALNRLSPSTRATFVLFAEAELSYKDIAECQGLPIGTVMSRLHYARQKLQSYLEGMDDL